jgi:Zn-finger nucleic acid-binding protein/ribosomal protein L40E
MRVLVACEECKRQYDASGRAEGDRFHCSCGAVVRVPAARAETAAVVRCSECGAPRQGQASACGYCGSEFTLAERDMHTLCPGCTARISDQAHFCHRCGTTVLPTGTAGEDTEYPCPVCKAEGESRLVSRQLGGQQGLVVLECGRCAGLWIGSEVFQLLERRAQQQSLSADSLTAQPEQATQGVSSVRQQGPLYRNCPVCDGPMARRNYARKSGIIVDMCNQHGLWFDAGELDAVLHWIREGGAAQAARAQSAHAQQQARAARVQSVQQQMGSLSSSGGASSSDADDFLSGLLSFFTW